MKDVMIVLGGGVTREGKCTPSSRARVEKAVHVYNDGASKNILMSGAYSNKINFTPMKTEAQAMKDYAVSLGVPEGNIFCEEFSMETVGNAFFSKEIVKEKGWQTCLVITSDFHAERTAYIFQKTFGEAFEVISTSHVSQEELEVRKQKEQEALAWLKQKLDPLHDGEDAVRMLLEKEFECYGTLK